MKYTITDYFGDRVELEPCLELYTVHDFMGKEMPGLAIQLYFIDEEFGEPELYEDLTVCFGEFISLRNAAYIDTNNCYFAQQLLEQGIAKDTGLKKHSGFCEYPLWVFEEDFLREIGKENYEKYKAAYDTYAPI